jgi:hypothetical protein
VKTCAALTEDLSTVLDDLRADKLDVKTAEAMANIAGKMIKANLGQLSYYELRGEVVELPFWEQPK